MGRPLALCRIDRSPRLATAVRNVSATFGVVCATSLGLMAGLAPVSARADITDNPAGPLASLTPPTPELIDRAGDRDWYAAPSRVSEQFQIAYIVLMTVTATNPSCPAAAPLLVSLHNPEVNWMRTFRVAAGSGGPSVPIPASDGRYLLAVSAADSGCSGLQYVVSRHNRLQAGNRKRGATSCRIRKAEAKRAAKAVTRKQKQLAASKAQAKRRHRRDLTALKRVHDTKLAEVKRDCKST